MLTITTGSPYSRKVPPWYSWQVEEGVHHKQFHLSFAVNFLLYYLYNVVQYSTYLSSFSCHAKARTYRQDYTHHLCTEVRDPLKYAFKKTCILQREIKSVVMRGSVASTLNVGESDRIEKDLELPLECRTSPSSIPATAASWCTALSDIEKTCHSTLLRLNDLITIQQLCDGNLTCEFKPVNPRIFFRENFTRYESILKRKKTKLKLDLDGDYENCCVFIDKELFSRVLDSIVGTSFENPFKDNSFQVMQLISNYIILYNNE